MGGGASGNLAGRVCAEHETSAVWLSPQQARGIQGGWVCGLTYDRLHEDDDGNLVHDQKPASCVHCGQPIQWSETARQWVVTKGLLFPHKGTPHEPKQKEGS